MIDHLLSFADLRGNTTITGQPIIGLNTETQGTVKISGSATVAMVGGIINGTGSNGVEISGDGVLVEGACQILGDAKIYGHASVGGAAIIQDQAQIFGEAVVSDNATIEGSALVHGLTNVYEEATVGGTAEIKGASVIRGVANLTSGVHDSVLVIGQ